MNKMPGVLVLFSLILSNTACTRQVLWNRYYADGMRELQAGNYADAENLLAIALKQAEHQNISVENKILTIRSFALTKMSLGKQQDARKALLKAGALIDSNYGEQCRQKVEVLEEIGLSFAKQKLFEKAGEKFREALSISEKLKISDPDNRKLLHELAFSEQNSGHPEEACRYYQRYFAAAKPEEISKNSNDLKSLKDFRLMLGKLHKEKELARANELFKKVSAKT